MTEILLTCFLVSLAITENSFNRALSGALWRVITYLSLIKTDISGGYSYLSLLIIHR